MDPQQLWKYGIHRSGTLGAVRGRSEDLTRPGPPLVLVYDANRCCIIRGLLGEVCASNMNPAAITRPTPCTRVLFMPKAVARLIWI